MADQLLGTTQVYILDKMDPNSGEFTTNLRNNLNRMLITLDAKESGYYPLEESMCGQLLFPDYTNWVSTRSGNIQYRPIFRKVIDTATLPNAGVSTIAHNIVVVPALPNPTTFRFTRIYGAATDPVNHVFIPLPYSSPVLNENISVYADTTNVYITTGINRTNFTVSQIVLEYTKF